MTVQWVLGWWNLIFVVPFGIALIYLAVSVTTGIDLGGDADADVDADFDHDLDVDHDIDADADADHDLEADGDADAQHESDHDAATHARGGASTLLGLLGFGRVPMSLLILIALFVWGISGFAATQALHTSIADGERVAAFAIPIAAAVTLVTTSLIASFFARVMPKNGSPATGRRDLVGRPGVAVLEIGPTFGLARVSPADGSPGVQVPCRVGPDQPPIPQDSAVVVLRFDHADQLFYVSTPDRMARARANAARPPETLATAPR